MASLGIEGLQMHQQPQALVVLEARGADALAATGALLLEARAASAFAATGAFFLLELWVADARAAFGSGTL